MIDGQSLGKLVATAAGLRIVRKPGVWKGSRSAKALRSAWRRSATNVCETCLHWVKQLDQQRTHHVFKTRSSASS